MIPVKDLKKGQIVWECHGGRNNKLEILEEPNLRREGKIELWETWAKNKQGDKIFLYQSVDPNLSHYGPKLYDSPQYIESWGPFLPKQYQIPEECKLVAQITGDGWYLGVESKDGNPIAMLAWPEQWGESKTPEELEKFGFEIV